MSKMLLARPFFVRCVCCACCVCVVCVLHVCCVCCMCVACVVCVACVLCVLHVQMLLARNFSSPSPSSPPLHLYRCIRPNEMKSPDLFQPDKVLLQLCYTGVLETTRIRKEASWRDRKGCATEHRVASRNSAVCCFCCCVIAVVTVAVLLL